VPQLPTESPTNITDGTIPSVFHKELEKKLRACATITDGITDGNHRWNSSVGISQRVGKKLRACATITDGITVEFYKRNIPSVTWWREIFFGALIRLYVRRKFRRYFYFFITDRNGDGIRITDAHDSNGFISPEIPLVIILPMVCVPYTNGINPSVKLYNGVVPYL